MKNLKENRGITLIALIITIILLLILAIVTISAVNEGNLFAHANNAATKYSDEAKLENEKISEWISKMEQYENKNTPVVQTNIWAERGITNVVIGATYSSDNGDGTTHDIKLLEDGNLYMWDKDTDHPEPEPTIMDIEAMIANGEATFADNKMIYSSGYTITCTREKLTLEFEGMEGTLDFLLQE